MRMNVLPSWIGLDLHCWIYTAATSRTISAVRSAGARAPNNPGAKLGKPRGTPRCCGASGRRGTVATGDTVTDGEQLAKGLKGYEGLQRL